jgi:hypothetical protein
MFTSLSRSANACAWSCRRGALGGHALVAVGAQQARQQLADRLLVVDDQDPLGLGQKVHQPCHRPLCA